MSEHEREPLLSRSEAIPDTIHDSRNAAYRTLPLALLASLGMAATTATAIYAYADLLCEDPTACKDGEEGAYAAVVAIANGIAHAVAIMILGPVEQLIKKHIRAGLLIWIVCRATSVLCLVIGVSIRSVTIAVSGRIFEGLASDNLLHFNLNTIYVSLASPSSGQETSQLIAASLGLYMLGTAVGPLALSVFQSYTASFTAALVIFSVALVYLVSFVRVPAIQAVPQMQTYCKILSSLSVLLSPLRLFRDHSRVIPYGLSLLLYTTVQAHLFPAIMVFASIRLHFGTFQNGLLVSTAAACAAMHLLLKVLILPSLQRLRPNSARFTDRTAVLGALVIQMLALAAIAQIQSAGQLYLAVSVAAAGLSLPAFFKSHFVSSMPDAPRAITALTFMENLGGLVSPLLLGSWQSVAPGPSVFAFAVALLGPWVKYRALNRAFKKEIEDYYFEHWINGSEIWVKREEPVPPDPPDLYSPYLREYYIFAGFRDSEQRIAVFEGQRLKWTDPRGREHLIQIQKLLNQFDEQGYHPYITFEIEKGVTDLLPIDLRFGNTITSTYFTFDWRTYLSTLLDELRYLDRYKETTGCKPQLRLALELRRKIEDFEMSHKEAMLHLVQAAGTELVGRDGRLLAIRRRRRYRLGFKTGKLRRGPRRHSFDLIEPSEHPGPLMNVLERRFTQLDEEHVAESLLNFAILSDQECDVQIEW
ncbi:hypothetical protein IFM61392_06780 [Aspergillus lentulus]|nr:hypothetical protein IFM61392_06780 [Aspergillus lentulus]